MSKIYYGDANGKAQHPKKIYVGGTDGKAHLVEKAYAGGPDGLAHQVWPYKTLPRAYQLVEYIYNTNTSEFINLGFKPTSNTRCYMKFYVDDSGPYSTGYQFFFGVESTYAFQFYKQSTNRKIRCTFAGYNLGVTDVTENTIYEIDFNKDRGHFYLDGTEIATSTATFTATSTNAILFGYSNSSNQNGKASHTPFRCYRFQAYEGNTIIRDMYPCYRVSDFKVGMLDMLNDVFYVNSGTNDFYPGPDVTG